MCSRAAEASSRGPQHVPLRASVNNCSTALRNFRLLGWRAPATDGPIAEGAGASSLLPPPDDLDGTAASAGAEEPVELVRGRYRIRPGQPEPGDGADRALGRPDEVAEHVQSFEVAAAWEGVRVDRVSLEVEDNHGEERFTCLYHPILYGDA
jgi:hypothetical protein